MTERATSKQNITRIEKKLDKWLKATPIEKNIGLAIYEVLDMSMPHIKKTWRDGYVGVPGGWRWKHDKSETGNLIARIEDVETRKRLWEKYETLVGAIYHGFDDMSPILFRAGCLDLLVEHAARRIKKLKKDEKATWYLWDIVPMLRNYLLHKDKISLSKDPQKTKEAVKKLLELFLNLIKDCEDFKNHYFESKSLVEFYVFHDEKIPEELYQLALYMIRSDKQDIRQETEWYEESISKLKTHMKKIQKALKL